VLLAGKSDDVDVKLSDFGLARMLKRSVCEQRHFKNRFSAHGR